MFVTDRLVYLQLQKTGGTHIVKLLDHVCGGQRVAQHNRLPAELRHSGRLIVGSVRNPWDWYVSLWAFGCSRKGALHQRLTSPDTAARDDWGATYADVDDPGRFREWLHRMHDLAHRQDLGERYGDSPASGFSGFYTYRYASLYAETVEDLHSGAAGSPEGLREILGRNVLDFTIRTERLEDDLLAALNRCGVPLTPEQIRHIRSAPKTNASRGRREAAFYYDDETIALVRAREAVLIEHSGHAVAPEPRSGGDRRSTALKSEPR